MSWRITAMLALIVMTAYANPPDQGPALQTKPVPIAFGALGSLEAGDTFVYELRFPKPGFRGAPPGPRGFPDARVPKRGEDFEKRRVRFVVVEHKKDDLALRVRLRIDRLDPSGGVEEKGIYGLFLQDADKQYHVTCYGRDESHRIGSSAMIEMVPFAFGTYPNVKAVPTEMGQDTVRGTVNVYNRFGELIATEVGEKTIRESKGDVFEFTCASDPDEKIVRVEANFFLYVPWERLEVIKGRRMKDVRFFDRKTQEFLHERPEGQPEEVAPVLLMWVEKQEWDFGAPLWKHMIRRNHLGVFQFECTLLEKGKTELAAPEEKAAPD